MMVNNSTNINKMYNHLALQTIERKNIMAYGVGNRGPGLGQVQKSAGFNLLVGSFIIICTYHLVKVTNEMSLY
jgi:hypothetical protein